MTEDVLISKYNKSLFDFKPAGIDIADGFHGCGKDFNLHYIDRTISHYLKADRIKVLEIGCGGGKYIKKIKKENSAYDAYGVDFSEVSINVANKNNYNINFSVMDITDTQFKDDMFDFVFGVDIFEHLENINAGFTEVLRILKKGGIFHLSIPLTGNPAYVKLLRIFSKKLHHNYCINTGHFTEVKINDLIVYDKFEILEQHYSIHFFGNIRDSLYYLVDPYFAKLTSTFFYAIFCKLLEKLTTIESSLMSNTRIPALVAHFTYRKL